MQRLFLFFFNTRSSEKQGHGTVITMVSWKAGSRQGDGVQTEYPELQVSFLDEHGRSEYRFRDLPKSEKALGIYVGASGTKNALQEGFQKKHENTVEN